MEDRRRMYEKGRQCFCVLLTTLFFTITFIPQWVTADPNPFTVPLDFNCRAIHAQIAKDPGAKGILADYLIDKDDIRGTYAANMRQIRELRKSRNEPERRKKLVEENTKILHLLKPKLEELDIYDVELDDMGLIVHARFNEPQLKWLPPLAKRVDQLRAGNPDMEVGEHDSPTTISDGFRTIHIKNQKTFDHTIPEVPEVGRVRIYYQSGNRLVIEGNYKREGELRYVLTNHDTGEKLWGLTFSSSGQVQNCFPNGKLPKNLSISIIYNPYEQGDFKPRHRLWAPGDWIPL